MTAHRRLHGSLYVHYVNSSLVRIVESNVVLKSSVKGFDITFTSSHGFINLTLKTEILGRYFTIEKVS
jgi:hypothetical protein